MSGIETANFPAGAVVFKEGDQPDGVYFIMNGGVEVSRNEAGVKIQLAQLGADAVFGEMALIDSQPRSATVMTIAATECMKGTTENFASLLSSLDPAVKGVMQQIVSVIREKNKTKKGQQAPNDVAMANAFKEKGEALRAQIMQNAPLIEKIKSLDPFLNGVFNSLLRLLVS